MEEIRNIAYIDGQNLHMGTQSSKLSWKVDLGRFRVYLKEKYQVDKAYYYLGFIITGNQYDSLYESIQDAGFILVFREHNSSMLGSKKGNVDADIVFSMMRGLCVGLAFNKYVLVSGDGDYKRLVSFLIEKDKLEKILFPNRRFRSSLYKDLPSDKYGFLDDKDVRKKIGKQKRKLP
jgi:uncharacterized LabA/DUF88 family protein